MISRQRFPFGRQWLPAQPGDPHPLLQPRLSPAEPYAEREQTDWLPPAFRRWPFPETSSRDLNQRVASMTRQMGTRKMEIPENWRRTSLSKAPNSPIQLWTGCDASCEAAVLNEASTGE